MTALLSTTYAPETSVVPPENHATHMQTALKSYKQVTRQLPHKNVVSGFYTAFAVAKHLLISFIKPCTNT